MAIGDLHEWAQLHGNWDLASDSASYEGYESDKDDAGLLIAADTHAITRGSITATVNFEKEEPDSQARIVVGYEPEHEGYIAIGLGGHDACLVVEEREPQYPHLLRIKVAGRAPTKTWPQTQRLTVHVKGRRLILMVNGASVLATLLPRALRSGEKVGLSAWGPRPVSFESIAIDREPPLVFVVMQFDGYERLYEDVIRPLESTLRLNLRRVDEVEHPGSIIADIEDGIAEADLVIAEITESNANVFYEVGFAYALSKPVVLIAKRSRKKLPFDLLVERCLFYEDSTEALPAVADALKGRVQAGLARTEWPID